jgi:hypothetical protein
VHGVLRHILRVVDAAKKQMRVEIVRLGREDSLQHGSSFIYAALFQQELCLGVIGEQS